jgi:transposase
MTLVGVDLHTREQSVALLDTETGEARELRLRNEGSEVERFYDSLTRPVTVGIESTGYAVVSSAHAPTGQSQLVGDAAKIRATVIRRTKTDRRDARQVLLPLREERFPTIWVPDPRTRDLRSLVAHRLRLARVRTMIKNGVHAIAWNYRLLLGASLFTRRGLAQLRALPLPPHTARRRDESLELVGRLDRRLPSWSSHWPRRPRRMRRRVAS